jgi:hypothetical protein
MWPVALGSAALGGLTGGLTAYQQSGGDLGKTLGATAIGAGLGAFSPAAFRMAGQALADSGLLATAAGGATSALGKLGLAGKLGLPATVSEQAARTAIGNVGKLGASFAIPVVAAGAAGIPGQVLRGGAGLGAAVGVPGLAPDRVGQFNPGAALSPEIAAANHPYSYLDATNPVGPMGTARTAAMLDNDVQVRNMLNMANAQYPIMSQAKKDEMARQLAAAQIRANIGINAEAMLGGLRTSQTMGINAANQMGDALAKQYQYG